MLQHANEISLEVNALTGRIPNELGTLPMHNHLEYLNIANNMLSGKIPPELCFITEHDCDANLCGCDCECNEMNHSLLPQCNGIYNGFNQPLQNILCFPDRSQRRLVVAASMKPFSLKEYILFQQPLGLSFTISESRQQYCNCKRKDDLFASDLLGEE